MTKYIHIVQFFNRIRWFNKLQFSCRLKNIRCQIGNSNLNFVRAYCFHPLTTSVIITLNRLQIWKCGRTDFR